MCGLPRLRGSKAPVFRTRRHARKLRHWSDRHPGTRWSTASRIGLCGGERTQRNRERILTAASAELPDCVVAPMWLRGRATGLLLALRTPEEQLAEVAKYGAAALELADGYTDVLNAARRRKETNASAEVQQSLLPPGPHRRRRRSARW